MPIAHPKYLDRCDAGRCLAPPEAVADLKADGAEVVCPLVTDKFFGVGSFYRDFRQLSDADVEAALDEVRREGAGT
jgi:predicted phosphoribosyltransferase